MKPKPILGVYTREEIRSEEIVRNLRSNRIVHNLLDEPCFQLRLCRFSTELPENLRSWNSVFRGTCD